MEGFDPVGHPTEPPVSYPSNRQLSGWIFPPPGETRSRGALLIFDSADDALAANERAGDWVRHNVLEFTKGMPEVMVGNTLIADAAVAPASPPAGQAPALAVKFDEGPTGHTAGHALRYSRCAPLSMW